MRILIGYSTCPHTRVAFEAKGHDVWTCDLRPDDHPRHLQCDIKEIARDPDWDMGIFHPTCTYLTVAAAWAYKDPDFDRYPGVGYHQKLKPGTLTGAARREAREQALDDFWWLLNLPYPKAIENPDHSFIHRRIRKADQAIHPHMFGDDASKRTGLWLTGLRPLRIPPKDQWVEPRMVDGRPRWANQTDSGQNRLSPSDTRWLERSRTYPGIAAAMAENWG